VLTYNQPPAALTSNDAQITANKFAGPRKMGELFISRFLPAEMAQPLRRHGFGDHRFGRTSAGPAYSPGALTSKSPGPAGLRRHVPPACAPAKP
jgi:hypothetical protein